MWVVGEGLVKDKRSQVKIWGLVRAELVGTTVNDFN
jgi:hypothetical protein